MSKSKVLFDSLSNLNNKNTTVEDLEKELTHEEWVKYMENHQLAKDFEKLRKDIAKTSKSSKSSKKSKVELRNEARAAK
jgi:regulator of replication initiation timing